MSPQNGDTRGGRVSHVYVKKLAILVHFFMRKIGFEQNYSGIACEMVTIDMFQVVITLASIFHLASPYG